MIPAGTSKVQIQNIPPEPKANPQWVGWKYIHKGGKPTKIPFAINGQPASSTDPKTWATYEDAVRAYEAGGYDGIGYVFSSTDGLCGIDLDHCVRADGTLEAWAAETVDNFASYTEISPSGKGLKIFIRAKKPGPKSRAEIDKAAGQHIEIYDNGRYFTVTGNIWPGSPAVIADRQCELNEIYEGLFGTPPEPPTEPPPAPQAEPAPQAGTSAVERCRKYLQKLPPAIEGSGGHNATIEAACTCFRFGLGQADAWALINEYNATCQPPWSEKELRHKLDDAEKLVRQAGEFGCMLRDDGARRPASRSSSAAATADIHLTDIGNGIRLAQRHGQKIRMVSGIGWHVWDGIRWCYDDTHEVERLAKETCRAMLAESAKIEDFKLREATARHALASEGSFRLQAMIGMAASEPGVAIRAAELDANPWLMNVQNGILNLRTGQLMPHDPAALMTKLAPVVYDPAATCPRFDQFVNEICDGNSDISQYVLKLLGHCLTGDIREQILPIAYGEGANGKSTLLGTVSWLLGDYAGLAPDSLLVVGKHDEHPCELAKMQGLRFVVGSETESTGRLKIQLVKRITGEEILTARRMRENYYEFKRTHKTILQTNNKPRINENSEAVWRRIKLIPFNVIFPEGRRDTELGDKLKAEAGGILNRLVAGCIAWQRDGLREPVEVRNATGAYRDDSDPMRDFLEDCCVRVPDAWTATSELYGAYTRRCEVSGERPMGSRQFGDALGRHGFNSRKTNRGRGWDGIGLSSPTVGSEL